MTTLFTAMLDLAKLVNGQNWYEGVTSAAGTPTTLIDDDRLGGKKLVENAQKRSPLFFLSGTLADNSVEVTAYAQGESEYSFATQSGSPGAAARYGVGSPEFDRQQLITAINTTLVEIGDVKQVNIATTTVKDQVEYTLPTDVYNVIRLEIATRTSSPYDYQEFHNFEEWQDTLIIPDHNAPTSSGSIMRLKYNAPHAEVTTDAGIIANVIPRELLKYGAAFHLLQAHSKDLPNRPDLLTIFQSVIAKYASMQSSFEPPKWSPLPRMADWMGLTKEVDRSLPN